MHFPALALNDAPDWFAEVRRRKGIATKALEFLAMCASRSGEIRGATWSEIDLELGLWTIPLTRSLWIATIRKEVERARWN